MIYGLFQNGYVHNRSAMSDTGYMLFPPARVMPLTFREQNTGFQNADKSELRPEILYNTIPDAVEDPAQCIFIFLKKCDTETMKL